jgi:hypothetical protein
MHQQNQKFAAQLTTKHATGYNPDLFSSSKPVSLGSIKMLATNLLVLHSGHFPSSLLTIAYHYHPSTLDTLHALTV